MSKLPLVLFIAFVTALFCSGMTTVLVPILVPNSVALTSQFVCPEGMRARSHKEVYTDYEGTHTSASVQCVAGDQVVAADSTKSLLIYMGMLFVPMFFVIGVLTFIFLKPAAPTDTAGMSPRPAPMTDAVSANAPLDEKLEQLQRSFQAGLITEEEFNQKKKALLDSF